MMKHFDSVLPPVHHLLVLQPNEAWSASDVIALLTLGAIIWTAWETVKLRKASFQAYYGLLEVDDIATKSKTNFIGLQYHDGKRKNINFRIFFKNIGTSSLTITGLQVEGYANESIPQQEPVDFAFNPRGSDIASQGLAPQDTCELDYMLYLNAKFEGEIIEVRFAINYKDSLGAYKHRFRIIGCSAAPVPQKWTVLDEGKVAQSYGGI